MINRIYVGVDISKNWFDVCTSVEENAPVERYSNNPDGHAKFIKAVTTLARKIQVCMEHTGGYETPLALACIAANLTVSLLDGAKLADYRKSHGRAKAKTDRQDARLIARFSKERKPALWLPVPDEYLKLRELVRHRESLKKAKTAWSCRAAHTVQSELVTAQRKALCTILALQIKEVDKAIAAHIQSCSELKEARELLISVPGIAHISAASILAESGPISNYKSAKDYALAAGLNPIVNHSGKKTPPGKLPVYGNAELRSALYHPAMTCKSHNIGVAKFMDRIQNNGNKMKMTVITAGMRKLAHIIYGVLTSKTKYDKNKP